MLPPKELSPSDHELFAPNLQLQRSQTTMEDSEALSLRERITELEARNLYLQSLVVELLDKNEQLRRKTVAQERIIEPS